MKKRRCLVTTTHQHKPAPTPPLDFRRLLSLAMMGSVIWLGGCVANHQAHLARHCPTCIITHVEIESELSPLVALTTKRESAVNRRLHIYLEGDGRPWDKWNQPSADPNSRRLTALGLMQIDPINSIYLNRPCYGVYPMANGCHNGLWTNGRYSESVVASMNAAINELQKHHQASQLVLVGHSGGGTLAMLLAERRTDVIAVITLAANLDHRAWTRRFGYLPLDESLTAVDVQLPADVLRWHFAAANDQQVPAGLVESAAALDPLARQQTIQGLDHTCCWEQVWPSILQELDDELTR